jgi:hypothetical protein
MLAGNGSSSKLRVVPVNRKLVCNPNFFGSIAIAVGHFSVGRGGHSPPSLSIAREMRGAWL